ncbi:MAG: DUF1028 domain-containing protein [Beijerinckiaceae bacterium]|nr:DUF1028 domain-containing protein [Beijerinckiaceae bacterium]
MTWSIVYRDTEKGLLGIAVSTCAFAVGSRVPFIETETGAIASQAFVNPFYGRRGIELMRAGASAEQMIAIVTSSDAGRGQRQVHAIDRHGGQAAYTGADCIPWCGHLVRKGFSVAGNMLSGAAVIEETARVFEASAGDPLPRRFLKALDAGEAAGGDKRGKQSAAILIHGGEEYPLLDIRVDDHVDPLAELRRLEAVSRQRSIHYQKFQPSRANPAGITDREELERLIAQSIAEAAEAESVLAAHGDTSG